MGLMVELREKMTSLSSGGGGGGSRPYNNNNNNNNNSNKQGEQVVRKKRTFDIAFLTGQSEPCDQDVSDSTINNNNNTPSNKNNNNVLTSSSQKRFGSSSYSSTVSTINSSSPGGCPLSVSVSEDDEEIPFNLARNTSSCSSVVSSAGSDNNSSSSSMIDVMTCNNNGDDASDTESLSPVNSPRHHHHNTHHHHRGVLSLTHPAVISVRHPHPIIITSSNSSSTKRKSKSNFDKVKGGSGGGSNSGGRNAYRNRATNAAVKEEIRFESKRTIDINHTSDSVKIKENLQFSTLIPSSASVAVGGLGNNAISSSNSSPMGSSIPCSTIGGGGGHGLCLPGNGDLILPQQIASTFALFPHISGMSGGGKFPSLSLPPMGHHHQNHNLTTSNSNQNHPSTPTGLHFSSSSIKMEKCDGINLSYHHHHHHHQNHPQLPHGHLSSKIRAAGGGGMVGFPDLYAAAMGPAGYPYPNLIIPQELAAIRHSQFSPPTSSNHPSGGGSGGNLNGNTGGHGTGQPSPPGGGGGGVTLLPPSLTALTLPAQNVCAKCNIGFRMTSDLVYHMRSHHKRDTFDPLKKQREEKLKCPVCHETFRERHHLTRHMTAHQDRKDEEINNAATSAVAAANSSLANNNSALVSSNGK